MDRIEALARKMYDDYCEAVGGKAFNGDALPKSDEFFSDPNKVTQAQGWRIASHTAFNFVLNQDLHD